MKILATLKPSRYQTSHQSYGVVAEIDWTDKAVIRSLKIPVPYFHDRRAHQSPRLQGLCIVGRTVYVAAWNFVVQVDYDSFQVVDAVSWPPMADVHGMATDGNDIWVASSAVDALLCLEACSLELKWRWGPDEPILYRERLSKFNGRKPFSKLPIIDRLLGNSRSRADGTNFVEREYRYVHKTRSPYYNHHLNDVHLHDEQLYITTKDWNRDIGKSSVIRLDTQSRESDFFVKPGGFRGVHDGVFLDGRFYVTESGANSVAWREPDGTITSRKVDPSPYFVRGLCYTGSSFLVGFSTLRNTDLAAQIVEYDTQFERQLSCMDIDMFYDADRHTQIHTIALSPD